MLAKLGACIGSRHTGILHVCTTRHDLTSSHEVCSCSCCDYHTLQLGSTALCTLAAHHCTPFVHAADAFTSKAPMLVVAFLLQPLYSTAATAMLPTSCAAFDSFPIWQSCLVPYLQPQSHLPMTMPTARMLQITAKHCHCWACRHGQKMTIYKYYASSDGMPVRLHMHGNDISSGAHFGKIEQ